MKTSILLCAAVTISSFVYIASAESPLSIKKSNNIEGQYACAIFPLCTDPDSYNPSTKGDKSKDKHSSDGKDLRLA